MLTLSRPTMKDDYHKSLSKPSKSVEEFVAKQIHISERLRQQPPPTKSRVLLWCCFSSLLTAALLLGAIYLLSAIESRRLKERGQFAARNSSAHIEKEVVAAPAAAEQFLDSSISTQNWVSLTQKSIRSKLLSRASHQ